MKARAFTLVELIVVIAIIGTLAGIAIPMGRSMVRRSREASCLNQLRSIAIGMQGYLQDHQNRLPELATGRNSKSSGEPVLETVLLPYVESEEVFHCPADDHEYGKAGSSYGWNHTQNGLHVDKLAFFGIQARPDKIPLVFDKEAWHPGGTNFLYADFSSSAKVRFTTGP